MGIRIEAMKDEDVCIGDDMTLRVTKIEAPRVRLQRIVGAKRGANAKRVSVWLALNDPTPIADDIWITLIGFKASNLRAWLEVQVPVGIKVGTVSDMHDLMQQKEEDRERQREARARARRERNGTDTKHSNVDNV